jgi:hypothetical protein
MHWKAKYDKARAHDIQFKLVLILGFFSYKNAEILSNRKKASI